MTVSSQIIWDCNVNGKERETWWSFMICLMKILYQEGYVGDYLNFHLTESEL